MFDLNILATYKRITLESGIYPGDEVDVDLRHVKKYSQQLLILFALKDATDKGEHFPPGDYRVAVFLNQDAKKCKYIIKPVKKK